MDNFEEHIVVFIDFLGFKNFNKKSKNVRMEFISFLEQIKSLDSDVTINEQKDKSKQFRVASSFYSDSLILAWPLNQEGLPIDSSIITGPIIQRITHIVVRALYFGLLIRGAITVGEFYHKNGIFLGRAFDEASYLESEIAIYPRIIISNDIFEKNLLTPQDLSIPTCRRYWLKDFDHIDYLNYFSCIPFRQAFWSCVPLPRNEKLLNEKVGKWIDDCLKIIEENINTFETSKNSKLLQKWQWFSDYFNNSIASLSENDSWTGAKL